MGRRHFKPEQIIHMLREAETKSGWHGRIADRLTRVDLLILDALG